MGKKMIAITVDEDILKDAKAKGFNISSEAEVGILRRLNREEYAESVEVDVKLAETDPENYWIDARDGKCKKRGKPQFFINEMGAVRPVSKEEYMRRYKHSAHKPNSTKPVPLVDGGKPRIYIGHGMDN